MPINIKIRKKLGNFQLDIRLQTDKNRIGILGASGCGKSMTLKSIAGIVTPDSGSIEINGKEIFSSQKRINWKPQQRNIGYMFQNYALFPTMTVKENIIAGVKGRREEKEARAREMLDKFQLAGLEKSLPGELSGGQQQRVALARIMAYEPEVILLDEPYSALDVFLKDRLQQEMQEMLKDYQGTVILVSHSRDEIYRFSEELVVMEQGQTICQGATREIFENPRQRESAKLTGCKNIAAARRLDDHLLEVPDWGIVLRLTAVIPQETAYVGIRAHDFVPRWGEKPQNCIPVAVNSVAELIFEKKFFLAAANPSAEDICWFVQRDQCAALEERGMPDYLQLPETAVLLLR